MSDVDRSPPEHRDPLPSAADGPGQDTTGSRNAAPVGWWISGAGRWWLLPLISGLATAALLAFLTWQVVVRGPLIAWDWPLHVYVDARQPSGFPREVLNGIASLGGQRLYTLPIVVSVGAWVAWKQRNIRPLIAIGAGLATVFFIGYWIKFSLARTAPHTGVDILHGEGQAFPSGHTANATLTWILIVVVLFGAQGWKPDQRRLRFWGTVALTVVFVSGMLMTLLDYHWFSDIPGGWLLGGLALAVSLAVLRLPVRWPVLRWPERSSPGHQGDGDRG
ncbi:phosphatase PAP2 family protein [Phytoactinopolyspora limicola]|uniref:phosphatase PAP2 family protein n=1 Tax=Phytoactinopolyspora limicola TaxID=2715536 RepID=UPI00140C2C09|nr:phosphatase PAP2 family protein [Phytoactinopolyspora limicola]